MRSQKLCDAYMSVRPDAQTRDRLLAQILAQNEARPRRHPLRTALLIAAAVALLAAVAAGGYAAYQRWTLPKPESYTPTEHGGYDVHTVTEYRKDEIDQAPEKEPLTDEYFIEQAVAILKLLGKTDVDTGKMTVTRAENMYWSREEAEVLFTESDNLADVKFNADTGTLIGLSAMDWLEGSESLTDLSAEELARRYYALLPVPQGYELTNVVQYDEQFGSYDFCRRVDENLINQYQMVRIAVNPMSGRLCNLVVFDVPLLDDHEPGDTPLTQAQAEEAAGRCEGVDLSGFSLKSAEVQIVMPNWQYTEYSGEANLRYSKVSRLAWVLIYVREIDVDGELWEDQIRLYIDEYTGELLGGDAIA